MTDTTHRLPLGSTDETRMGTIARWRLTEPVRLYLWPVLALLIVGGVGGGIVTQDWADWALPIISGIVAVPAVSAARASVYSAPGVIRELQRVRGR